MTANHDDPSILPTLITMKLPFITLLALSLLVASGASALAQPVSLFDGNTLAGWDYDPAVWRVEDGLITGGSTTEKIKENFFIATDKSYQNFELKLTIKCGGDPATGMINSGIQIRSVRVRGGNHMSGYQVDCGSGWFGKIYDEFRRRKVIAGPVDAAALEKIVDVYGWNTYRIRAEGPRIRVWINDVLATDYTEDNPNIALDGRIAPQVHSGGVALVQFNDITIEELPPTPGAPTWESLGGVEGAMKLAPPDPKPTPAPQGKGKGKAQPPAQPPPQPPKQPSPPAPTPGAPPANSPASPFPKASSSIPTPPSKAATASTASRKPTAASSKASSKNRNASAPPSP